MVPGREVQGTLCWRLLVVAECSQCGDVLTTGCLESLGSEYELVWSHDFNRGSGFQLMSCVMKELCSNLFNDFVDVIEIIIKNV
jgi:hypothetical protein